VILNGWKQIGRYLGCGVRTAQRWEICFGLPIVRLGRADGKGTVVAYTDDIDSWLRQRCRPEQLRERIRELEIENENLKQRLALAESDRMPTTSDLREITEFRSGK
jgi:hypothetical protein